VAVESSSVLILVVGILIAILLVLAGFVIPIFLTGGAGTGRQAPSRPRPRRFADSPAGHLIVGFSYLYPRLDFARSRGSLQRRMQRAIRRVDSVDPYAAPRRIGSALLQAGLVDTGTPPTTEEPEVSWSDPGVEPPWPATDEPESMWESTEPEPRSPATGYDPNRPSPTDGIWTQADPDAEFPSPTEDPGSGRFDRPGYEQPRDIE
jgi:hypothetical protein